MGCSPEELGLRFAAEAPNAKLGKQAFELWVENACKKLQAILDKWQSGDRQNVTIQQEIPQKDIFVEWVYTIDFDNGTNGNLNSHPSTTNISNYTTCMSYVMNRLFLYTIFQVYLKSSRNLKKPA